jgi:hypothetical protein
MSPAEALAVVEQPAEAELARVGVEPWSLLASQVSARHSQGCSGERRLMAAILGDAIQVYVKGRQRGMTQGLLYREAEEWIESRDRRSLFAFETVCDVLHLDADRLRRVLRAQGPSARCHAIPVDACRLRVARGRKMRI